MEHRTFRAMGTDVELFADADACVLVRQDGTVQLTGDLA